MMRHVSCVLAKLLPGVAQIIEQIMEHVAEVSGVDPVEVRRLNFLKACPMAPTPQIRSSSAGEPAHSGGSLQVHLHSSHTLVPQSSYLPTADFVIRVSFASRIQCIEPESRCVPAYAPAATVWSLK